MLFQPFPNAFGIDISDLSIKVVQLRGGSMFGKKKEYELVTARSMALPPGLIENGELKQPTAVLKYIRRVLDGNGSSVKPIKSPWAVASLPESQSFLKVLTIQKPADDILEDDVVFVAQKHIPFEPDTYYLDWQVLATHANAVDKTSVLVATISKTVADTYTTLLEEAGLGVVALDTETLANTRAMMLATDVTKQETIAFLDLGADRSSVTVLEKGVIRYSINLVFSGEQLTNHLMQKLKIPYEEAEREKRIVGVAYAKGEKGKEKKQKAIWSENMKAVEELAVEVERALHYYYSHFDKTSKVTRIVMSGGAAQMKGLGSVLEEQLKVPVTLGDPWTHVRKATDLECYRQGCAYFSTALGLSIRALESPL